MRLQLMAMSLILANKIFCLRISQSGLARRVGFDSAILCATIAQHRASAVFRYG